MFFISYIKKSIERLAATKNELSNDKRERATVVKDYTSFYIKLPSGKVWRNIGCDLSGYCAWCTDTAQKRSKENNSKLFTKKELAYIYLFDPLGVEYYMRRFHIERKISVLKLLRFKDSLYKEIFGETPQLFEIGTHNIIEDKKSLRKSLFSLAEILFGAHKIDDSTFIEDYSSDLLENVFYKLPSASDARIISEPYQVLFFASAIHGGLKEDAADFIDEYIFSNFGASGDKMLGWCGTLLRSLSVHSGDLTDFILENMHDRKIYNRINKQPYDTWFVVENNEVSLKDIINHSKKIFV